jgi:ABC-type glycerol-3-phosphate transport system permease component
MGTYVSDRSAAEGRWDKARVFTWATVMKRLRTILSYVAMIAIVIAMVFPIAWLMLSSLKGEAEIVAYPPTLWPREFTTIGYERLFTETTYPIWFKNTVIVAVATTICAVWIAAMGAYVLTRSRARFVQGFSQAILYAYIIPQILLVVPIFRIVTNLRLSSSLAGLVVVYVATLLPYGLWTLRAYFAGIPHEIEESALIDGASRFQAFYKVVLPQALPGLIATAVFCFNVAWGEVLFATILLSSNRKLTITPGISVLYGVGDQGESLVLAASALATLPLILLWLALQRYLVAGWGGGGVKG